MNIYLANKFASHKGKTIYINVEHYFYLKYKIQLNENYCEKYR